MRDDYEVDSYNPNDDPKCLKCGIETLPEEEGLKSCPHCGYGGPNEGLTSQPFYPRFTNDDPPF